MKIKKIIIHGFKSFVDRVQLNFHEGTSAIVGPNGCGKSNVVDAIRWVLGEHNARHLRGKNMEDLIFNGSDSRKPVGMAEVTIVLSNEGGTAPARYSGFTEIEVQRRLYRSGESEYYINKIPSRLKDIVELFADTGIGTNAYSIIEQGQVGWLVNAKPEERRVIFEEAAGITKFKQKKAASIRRLEATKDNLTRVNDIISEVKRQLNSLNRQAKKAERYKLVKDELKDLELRASRDKIAEIAERLAGVEQGLVDLKDREIEGTAQADSIEGAIEKLRLEYLESESEFKLVRERAAKVEDEIRSLERTVELKRLRCAEIERDEQRLTEEMAALEAKRELLADERSSLEAGSKDKEADRERAAGELATVEGRLDTLRVEIDESASTLASEEAAALEMGVKITDLRHAIGISLKEEEGLKERAARAGAETAEIEASIDAIRGPVEEIREKISESTRRRDDLEAARASKAEELEGLEDRQQEMEEELKGCNEERARVSSRLATLEEMEKKHEGLSQGVRSILDSDASVRGLLADVIEPHAGCEKAVEAVLGERLQYVIVEDQTQGVEAIEHLKSHASGRGSFIPVREVRCPSDEAGQGNLFDFEAEDTGHVGELIDKVRVREGYESIVGYLLRDALLVDDLKSARRLWNRNGCFKTFVTPDGEMIDKQGALTGGFSNGADGGILHQRRQISVLRADVSTLGEKINRLEGAIEEGASRVERVRTELEERRDTLHAEALGNVNLASELKLYEEDLARLGRRREELTSEIAGFKESLAEIAEQKFDRTRERDELEAAKAGVDRRLTEHKVEHEAQKIEKERIERIASDARVELAGLVERIESIKSQLAGKQRLIDEYGLQVESKTAELGRGRTEKEEALAHIASREDDLSGLVANKDAVKLEEIEGEEALGAINCRIATSETELTTTKKTLVSLVEKKAEAGLDKTRLELETGSVKERMMERYGVDPEHCEMESVPDGVELPEGEEAEARIEELRAKIVSMGEVSLSALEEYAEQEKRHIFLIEQRADLEQSVDGLMNAIARINRTTRERFKKTFDAINETFKETFPKFFNGGRAELRLSDESNVLESGVEIVAQPPGKRLQNIMLLSGGEKALTATAFIFAVFLIKPSPFCLLDEVDAPLDDANIERFNSFVKELSLTSQFILITHNKRTMEVAKTLYGITMEEGGVSKAVSVEF